MLAQECSPIHLLVSSWWNSLLPRTHAITDMRVSLFNAATEEILRNQTLGKVYDPLSDNRFKWAAQWLDLADRCIPVIDPSVAQSAAFIFNEAAPQQSRQHAAANNS